MSPTQDALATLPIFPGRRGRLGLRTLMFLRWLALAGQTAAVLYVSFVLDFDTPLALCLGVIAAGAWMNVVLLLRRGESRLSRDWDTALQLAFDVVQLSVLLAFLGGLDNPFTLLLIAPVTIAAETLPRRQALTVGLLALLATLALYLWSLPLPWFGGPLQLPSEYRIVTWAATVVGVVFTGVYAWQAASEAGRMELALAATQTVLAREQRLAALGGLAAAAAHELGTPLATIQVVAKELLNASPPDDPVAEDARLLLQQAERCRAILKRLSEKPESGDAVHARLGLTQLLEEVADPYRNAGPRIETSVKGPPGEFVPDVRRLPEVVHALSAFVENASDFALYEVQVCCRFDAERITVEVRDDGPGFSPEILSRLGEPYVTSRPEGQGSRTDHQGMGLGFFIAKTLLERTGGRVVYGNVRDEDGALVSVSWPRAALEAES
ncbi:MAG TPA: ActS/PrrB/RegB family redox-sensitive histidine kinase [Caulobacteraceae bacterium]